MALRVKAGALAHRDYALFFSGQLVSLIGSWMQSLGQSWLVLQLTGSPWKLGLISTLQFTPMLLFSLFSGAIIDRLPKRRVIIATQSLFMLLAFSLSALVWTERVQYWHLAALALALGLVNTFDLPARQSFVVDMVGKEDLASAVALNSAIFNGGRIVGPAIAGLVIARYGIAPAFFFNGVSFIAVIAALSFIRAEGLPKAVKQGSMLQEIGEGIKYVWRSPLLTFVIALVLFVGVLVINWSVLVPSFARGVLHQEAQGFGGLMSALGVGALVGALLRAAQNRSDPSLRSIIAPAVLMSVASISMRFVTTAWVAAIALFFIGFGMIQFLTSSNTKVQMAAPDHLRGRVMSLYVLANAGTAPLGSLYMGAVTEAFGASTGFLVGGSLGLIAIGLLMFVWFRVLRPRLDG
ncbi:MAG TPA: MFS transporter [Symbiobacteriaceae bacterium]|nr:MFS transporter [Symbiobacteriaceae bacterium]